MREAYIVNVGFLAALFGGKKEETSIPDVEKLEITLQTRGPIGFTSRGLVWFPLYGGLALLYIGPWSEKRLLSGHDHFSELFSVWKLGRSELFSAWNLVLH